MYKVFAKNNPKEEFENLRNLRQQANKTSVEKKILCQHEKNRIIEKFNLKVYKFEKFKNKKVQERKKFTKELSGVRQAERIITIFNLGINYSFIGAFGSQQWINSLIGLHSVQGRH